MMDPKRNAANLQRLYNEVMNRHDVQAADALITADRPDHDPTFPPEFTTGLEGFKKLMTMMIGAFPDMHFSTGLMVADGNMVAAFNQVSGTQRGEFLGLPPSGKSFTVNNADFCRFTEDSMICEHWGLIDVAAIMRQLGAGS